MGRKKKSADGRSEIPWRIKLLLTGVILGVLWGVVMWAFGGLVNDSFEVRNLVLAVLYSGMIGGGVAAVFGIFAARKRGEKVMGKSPYRKYQRRR